MKRFASFAIFFLISIRGWAQYAKPVADWNRPAEPFRIVGNIYYVGASSVSSILITTSAGHILLESGFRETVPLIEANMKKLGFRFDDIRVLLSSHAHYDHSGGLAEIKSRTKARLLSSPMEAKGFARGGKGDPNLGDKYPFPPIEPDRLLRDGEEIRLGGTVITVHFTPGHTRGCMTFATIAREAQRSYHVVFPCSLTAPGYQLVNNPEHPNIVEDFEATFTKLSGLPCDIFIPPHSSAVQLFERSAKGGREGNPFADPERYRRWLDNSRAAFRRQMQGQK